jgi:hypothetical protein
MWNSSYGCNGEGYAIVIDRVKIKEIKLDGKGKKNPPKNLNSNLAELYKVIYVGDKNQHNTKTSGEGDIFTADNLLKSIANSLLSIFESGEFKSNDEKRKNIIDALAKLFSQIAHIMKYDYYEYENEHRLIYTAQIADLKNYIRNDDINDGTYLYTEPKLFSKKSKPEEKTDEILLGPLVSKIKHSKIEHQIKSRKYDVQVKHSEVPYRKT